MQKNEIFLAKDKIVGIIKIENMISSKILLVKSLDVVKDLSKIRFELDLGNFENKELQEDYEKTGLELFDIAIDQECPSPGELENYLEKRKKDYLDSHAIFYQEG